MLLRAGIRFRFAFLGTAGGEDEEVSQVGVYAEGGEGRGEGGWEERKERGGRR